MVVDRWTSDVCLSKICDLFGLQLGVRSEKQIARAQLFSIIYRNIEKRRTKLWQLDNISKPLLTFKEDTISQFGGGNEIHDQ